MNLGKMKKPVGYFCLLAFLVLAATLGTLIWAEKTGHNAFDISFATYDQISAATVATGAGAFVFLFIDKKRKPDPGINIHNIPIEPPRYEPNTDYNGSINEEGSALENVLSAALVRSLKADLNITLKLPADTKLRLLNQEWEVKMGEITIKQSANAESKPALPEKKKEEQLPEYPELPLQ